MKNVTKMLMIAGLLLCSGAAFSADQPKPKVPPTIPHEVIVGSAPTCVYSMFGVCLYSEVQPQPQRKVCGFTPQGRPIFCPEPL